MKPVIVLIILSISINVFAARFGSYNIRNFDYDERAHIPTNKSQLRDIISEMNADLIAVQEIRETHVFDNFIQLNFPGFKVALTNCGGAHGQKLGFVYNSNMYKLLNFKEDLRTVNVNNSHPQDCNNGSRPIAIGTFEEITSGRTVTVLSVHLKSGGMKKSIDKRFKQIAVIKDVVEAIKKQITSEVIVMGDFNSTEYIHKGSEYNRFKRSAVQMNMVDASSEKECTSYWWGGVQDGLQHPSLLDHILVSKAMTQGRAVRSQLYGHCAKLDCSITNEEQMGVSFDEVSDHCPQVIEL